jgi:NhaP-type Na+/H+ or K+/H+ antiporter
VFFTIFSNRYYHELGKEGFGEEVGWARGFALFFQMSLGGMCVGIAFGLGMLLVLRSLDKRFSGEENIVQVTATAAIAYVGYYVAEVRMSVCMICVFAGTGANIAS